VVARSQVERAHLLQEIIDTLEADGNAYAQKRYAKAVVMPGWMSPCVLSALA
jgi:hypothetical protein